MLLDFEQPDQQALLDALLAGLSKKSDSDFDNESINPVCNMSFSILYINIETCYILIVLLSIMLIFNPIKRGIGGKPPTFVQNDFTP